VSRPSTELFQQERQRLAELETIIRRA
jgi:hypothetical protein